MKNKKKKASAMCGDRGPTWVGMYERKTPTKQEKIRRAEKKYKNF